MMDELAQQASESTKPMDSEAVFVDLLRKYLPHEQWPVMVAIGQFAVELNAFIATCCAEKYDGDDRRGIEEGAAVGAYYHKQTPGGSA
jgi:hypothetical protein